MIILLFIFIFLFWFCYFERYKICPSDKVIVVFGKGIDFVKCVHGGDVYVKPVIQDYGVLSLEPITADINLRGALSKGNIRVVVPATFTFAISLNPKLLQNAAQRLLSRTKNEIANMASDIILGQLRLVVATLSIEEIVGDKQGFEQSIKEHINIELNKIGMEILSADIKDIIDDSGCVDKINKKALEEYKLSKGIVLSNQKEKQLDNDLNIKIKNDSIQFCEAENNEIFIEKE